MDRLTSPALSSFFRSLLDPLLPSPFQSPPTIPARTSTTLEFFDNDLLTVDGARILLNGLKENPRTDRLSASQNRLADFGVEIFCEGFEKQRAGGGCLRELNLCESSREESNSVEEPKINVVLF